MKNGAESLIFRNKVDRIMTSLKMLRQRSMIDDQTYCDFILLTMSAMTTTQLDQLDQDLAEILQGKDLQT